MPSLLDNPHATGNTQEMDMSGSQGSIKRDGRRSGEEPRKQLRRTVSRTKQREGGASGLTTVVPKPNGDGKVEQKSLNKIMLKAILKAHQTMRDLSSTVWDTLLIIASSPEADSMQKQTQTCAEKVRQEGHGHQRGPPFVWLTRQHAETDADLRRKGAARGTRAPTRPTLRLAYPAEGNAVGTRTAQGIATYWARLEPLSRTRICEEVRFCRLDKTYSSFSKHSVKPRYGRAPPTAMEREQQTFLEDLLKT